MKWKAVLCAAVIGITSFGTAPVQTVNAEAKGDGHTSMLEIPFSAEVYTYAGKYYHTNMLLGVDIQADGKIVFSIFAQEDFDIENSESFSPQYDIEYCIPDWLFIETENHKVAVGNSTQEGTVYISYSENIYSPDECNRFKIRGQYGAVQYASGEKIGNLILTGLQGGNKIYTDEQEKMFVRRPDGSKEYFHDIVSVTINGVTLSKEIGDRWAETEPIVYKQGDINSDDKFSISDLVMFQNWLLGREVDLPCWRAANFCKDDRLDVFDLCLMRRKLIERR